MYTIKCWTTLAAILLLLKSTGKKSKIMRKYWIGYFFLFISLVITFKITSGSPLDDYVNAPDPHFRWTQLQMFPYSLYTIYVLNMTSQKWFDGKKCISNHSFILFYYIICFRFSFITTHMVASHDNNSTSSFTSLRTGIHANIWWLEYRPVSISKLSV